MFKIKPCDLRKKQIERKWERGHNSLLVPPSHLDNTSVCIYPCKNTCAWNFKKKKKKYSILSFFHLLISLKSYKLLSTFINFTLYFKGFDIKYICILIMTIPFRICIIFFIFLPFVFLGPCLQHMEVPRLGVKSEL